MQLYRLIRNRNLGGCNGVAGRLTYPPKRVGGERSRIAAARGHHRSNAVHGSGHLSIGGSAAQNPTVTLCQLQLDGARQEEIIQRRQCAEIGASVGWK